MYSKVIFFVLFTVALCAKSPSPSRTPSPSPSPSSAPSCTGNCQLYNSVEDSYYTQGQVGASPDYCVNYGTITHATSSNHQFPFYPFYWIPSYAFFQFDTTDRPTGTTLTEALLILQATCCSGGGFCNPNGNVHDVYQVSLFDELTITSAPTTSPYNCVAQPTLGNYQGTATVSNGQYVIDLTSLFQSSVSNGVQTAIRVSTNSTNTDVDTGFCTKESSFHPILRLKWA